MGLEKAIKSGKEHREEYRGAKAVDPTCRNHGSCPWCTGNRTNKNKARDKEAKEYINTIDIYTPAGVGKLSSTGYGRKILQILDKAGENNE